MRSRVISEKRPFFYSSEIKVTSLLKKQFIELAKQFKFVTILDHNDFEEYPHQQYDFIAAFADYNAFECLSNKQFDLDEFESFETTEKDWIFGHFNYEIKNSIESYLIEKKDKHSFPKSNWFIPEHLIVIKNGILYLSSKDEKVSSFWELINNIKPKRVLKQKIDLKPSLTKEQYLEKINKVQEHIQQGNIYEANFCYNWSNEQQINPYDAFLDINEFAANPFTTFYKINGQYALCASPERFMQKNGTRLISQPIKGTAKIDLENNNQTIIEELEQNAKERSENIMIVDLVRNDLSKIAKRSSVNVLELCKAYSFPKIIQLISTIECQVEQETTVTKTIKALFPIGSMTGAPKTSCVNITDELEPSARGIYAGTIGYRDQENNWDFNVVIRTLIYSVITNYVSVHTGGAITSKSEAIKEYEETIIKFNSFMKPFI